MRPVSGPRYAVHFDDGDRPLGANGSIPMEPLLLWGGAEGLERDCASFERLEKEERYGREGGGAAYAAHMIQSQRLLAGGLPNFIEGRFAPKALLALLAEVLKGFWPLEQQVSSPTHLRLTLFTLPLPLPFPLLYQ